MALPFDAIGVGFNTSLYTFDGVSTVISVLPPGVITISQTSRWLALPGAQPTVR